MYIFRDAIPQAQFLTSTILFEIETKNDGKYLNKKQHDCKETKETTPRKRPLETGQLSCNYHQIPNKPKLISVFWFILSENSKK